MNEYITHSLSGGRTISGGINSQIVEAWSASYSMGLDIIRDVGIGLGFHYISGEGSEACRGGQSNACRQASYFASNIHGISLILDIASGAIRSL